jgi:hypothetical protein
VRAGDGDEPRLHYWSGDDGGALGSSGVARTVSDPPDPPPQTIQTTVAITAHSHLTARAIVTPFRIRLVEACSAALDRLEAKSGPEHNIFAETGEVLFWLHAIGETNPQARRISSALKWARDQYAHGKLLSDVVEVDYGAVLGHLVLDKSRLDAPPQHVWMATKALPTKPHPASDAAEDYDENFATQPVIATLRAEFSRLA